MEKLKPFWNFMRSVSRCLDTWDSRSVASGTRSVLQKLPQLARGSRTCPFLSFHLQSTMDTLPFPMRGRSPLLRTINPERTLLLNLPTASCDKDVQIVNVYTFASAFPLAVVMTVGSFDCLMYIFQQKQVQRDAPLCTKEFSIFMVAI